LNAAMQAQEKLQRLLGAAVAARQKGNRTEEARLLDDAVRLAPDDPRALNARGMAALGSGDAAMARRQFAAAAELDPNSAALWLNVAAAERALGNDEGEKTSLDRALSADRLNFMALLRLAELHQRRSESKEAAVAWQAVVQMAAKVPDPPPLVQEALGRGQSFLLDHGQTTGAAVEAELGPRLAALGPGARRVRACIDHSLGRRRIYQNHCAGLYVPFLPADEFFERESFPWMGELEARTAAIRDEALKLLEHGGDAIRPYVRQEAGMPTNKWSGLDGNLAWSACFLWEYGERNDAVCALCPETAEALASIPQNRIPGKAPTAFFSILAAGAHIPPHTGVTNSRAIVHLPLVVPSGCRFRVGGETREWREGEAFAFDDTIEHEAWNDSGEPRIVLIFDVWNPHLTPDEQDQLADYFQVLEQPRDA
jgi:aspartyl/asparaginyl beta-hydroxylase (cupin superfamily)